MKELYLPMFNTIAIPRDLKNYLRLFMTQQNRCASFWAIIYNFLYIQKCFIDS